MGKCSANVLSWPYFQVLVSFTIIGSIASSTLKFIYSTRHMVVKQTIFKNLVFKNQINLSNVFRFKDRLPYDFIHCVVYKFQCGRYNPSYYGETDRHLKIRPGEHIRISPLTFRKVKPSAESSIRDHILFCNHDPSFDDFTILAQGTNKFF